MYYPVLSLIPKVLVKKEDKEISTKRSQEIDTRKNVRGQFDEGINIKRGRNDHGFWFIILSDVLTNVHYFGLSFVRLPFVLRKSSCISSLLILLRQSVIVYLSNIQISELNCDKWSVTDGDKI